MGIGSVSTKTGEYFDLLIYEINKADFETSPLVLKILGKN